MTDRRSVLAAMALAAGGAALPFPALGAGRARPPRLRPGDVVGLVEPAGYTSGENALDRVRYTVEGMGLVPRVGEHVSARHGYLAGTDAERAADLNAMYADPEVRAVFAVRGGWGSARILPLLDWEAIRASPKLLIGYSDITALHLAFAQRAGYPTIHAPNAGNSWPEASWNSFWWLAFAGVRPELPLMGTAVTPGQARGRLIGGNLSVLSPLIGTPWMPDCRGAILFLEDVGEAPYRIDRMLSHLKLAGILDQAAGVIFGQCRDCTTGHDDYEGFSIADLMQQYLAPLGVPAVADANIGHVYGQLSVPVGCEVELDADASMLRVMEAVVE